ncbi:MAG: oxygenase MpaB family protein [Sandaracinaceae bacterium]|nr:oxygenase MpaB family protein [Sandaracinaceae bacterium]
MEQAPPSRWKPFGKDLPLIDLPLFRPVIRPDDPRIEQVRQALFEGDPLADEVSEWIAQDPSREPIFAQAVHRGIDSIPNPPPVLHRFFASVDKDPPWLDRQLVSKGTECLLRAGPIGHASLGSVSLLSGYLSLGAVKPLMATRALLEQTRRRLAETAQFVVEISRSKDLSRFSSGFRAALLVRMGHAKLRLALRQKGDWKRELWGEPINQHDMLATVLEFSTVYITGLTLQGYLLTQSEREAIMHLWRYLGWVLGVREELLPRSFREGVELGLIVSLTEKGPDEDGKKLAQALVGTSQLIHRDRLGKWLGWLRTQNNRALSRIALGPRAMKALGLEVDPSALWVFIAFSSIEAIRSAIFRLLPGGMHLEREIRGRLMAWSTAQELEGKPPWFVSTDDDK